MLCVWIKELDEEKVDFNNFGKFWGTEVMYSFMPLLYPFTERYFWLRHRLKCWLNCPSPAVKIARDSWYGNWRGNFPDEDLAGWSRLAPDQDNDSVGNKLKDGVQYLAGNKGTIAYIGENYDKN